MQCNIINASNQCQQCNIPTIHTNCLINNIHFNKKLILIRSDAIIMNYPKNIKFLGNVNIKENYHTLISDQITIFYNKKHNLSYTLYASGHINYNNNYIKLTGQQAWINLNNKNIDIYKGAYYLKHSNIHGFANTIIQRENNRYTIIKKGNLTSCFNNNYWNITGSQIMYDHIKNNINIWNAYFKIKKIPIFYIPYLSSSLNEKNMFTSYIPNIKYNNKHGLIFKFPYPIIYSSKHYSGNITPYYISNIGIKLQTKIHYIIQPNTGLMIFDIIKKHNKNNKYTSLNKNCYKNLKNLHWKHNNIVHKKWNFNADYISNNNSNFSDDTNSYHANIINNNINQKFICRYNNKNWNASIAYLSKTRNSIIKRKNLSNYAATPQLTLNSYYNFHIQKHPFVLKIHNQFTKFTPEIHSHPEAIRIHTAPSIHYAMYNNQSNFNIETKLNITYYQQKNIKYYNARQHTQDHLHNTINRIIPQFKIHGKIMLKNKTYIFKKYQYFLESKLQYLYTPYCFQENIYLYDTSLIHTDYNNFFNDSTYSGLDRIAPVNQITNNIMIHCINHINKLFYASIGQTINFFPFYLRNINTINNKNMLSGFILLSGMGQWNINNYWKAHTEIQYDIQYHNLPFGTAILEYIGKHNHTIQTHYRYINAQYIQKKTLFNLNESIYHKTITQFGILIYIPIHNTWKISLAHYYNIKTKKPIDQTIGIQYYTSCWNISTSFERKIIGFNKICQKNTYDNTVKLDIKISHIKNNFKSNPYKILNMSILPYQYIF